MKVLLIVMAAAVAVWFASKSAHYQPGMALSGIVLVLCFLVLIAGGRRKRDG